MAARSERAHNSVTPGTYVTGWLADAFAKRMHSRTVRSPYTPVGCHLPPSPPITYQAKHSGHCLRDCLLIRARRSRLETRVNTAPCRFASKGNRREPNEVRSFSLRRNSTRLDLSLSLNFSIKKPVSACARCIVKL